MPLLNTRELKDKYKNQRTAFVEEAVEAGMPFFGVRGFRIRSRERWRTRF